VDQRQQALRRPGQRARLVAGPALGQQPAEDRPGQWACGQEPPGGGGELVGVDPGGGPGEGPPAALQQRLQQRPPGQVVGRGRHVLGAAQQRPADHAAVLEDPGQGVALEPGQAGPEREVGRLGVLGVQPGQPLDRLDHG
jgi:hypothetical protein